MGADAAEPRPSATVVLVRDADSSLELLLLQRAVRGDRPGPWVFPGGKVEATDRRGAGGAEEHARVAALRETREEAGLALDGRQLVTISRWITPEVAPRRFDTWFFLGRAERGAEVRVDGSEIRDHRWVAPRAALDAHASDEIRLAPPTFVTVAWLAEHARADDALERLGRGPVLTFRPRIVPLGERRAVILYPGDAGYEAGDPDRAGARHRLWAEGGGYRYERESG